MDTIEIEKIKELIESGDKTSFDLAVVLIEGNGLSAEDFISEHYLDFINFVYKTTSDRTNLISTLKDIICHWWCDLSNYKLTTIPKEYLYLLRHQQNLRLHGNQLSEIPTSLLDFTNLKLITLCYNNIKNLPNNPADYFPNTITTISFSDISEIPVNYFSYFNSLESLGLIDTKIERIPDEISQLTNLKEFWIGGSTFNTPKEVRRLKKLLPSCKIYRKV